MSSLKLLVNNLPEGSPEELKEEILKLFQPLGTVANCVYYRNNYIMVELDSEESCLNAVKELNGKTLQEKELSVERIVTPETENFPVIKLSVTNVAAGIESEEIKDLFTKYGMVSDCKIEYGNGYVKVEATGDIRTAIKEMNGFVIDGVIMKVEPDVNANKAAVKAPPPPTPAVATPATAAKTPVIKKTVSGKKSQRGRGAANRSRGRGRGRIGLVRQFYEDEDLSALSISNQEGYYDDYGNGNYYDDMECDAEFYPPDAMMGGPQNFIPRRPGMNFRPPMQDPSFFPRRGMRGGPPGRLLRAPGPPRPDGPPGYPPRLPMGGPEPGRGRFPGLRGRGMPPGPMGRGSARGSFNGRGMMRGRGVFRGGPNGRGFPQGPFYPPEEEFYEDEMPGQYLTPGNEMTVRIPRYAPFESSRHFPQPPMNRSNGPPPYYDGGYDGGYEEEPMEQEYYQEQYYEEEYYEDEVIAPPPYLGSGGGYRESAPNFKNMRSSFNRQPNQRSNPQQQRQNVSQERPKKRTVAPGEPYPPPPLKPAGSFVPPKKKFRGGGNQSGGNAQRGKKKNTGSKINGNTVPLGGGGPGGQMGMRPMRPAGAQSGNRPPALAMRFPGGGGGGGSPRFAMRPQKSANSGLAPNPMFRSAGANRGSGPRMTSNNGVRSQAIDFTADIDLM